MQHDNSYLFTLADLEQSDEDMPTEGKNLSGCHCIEKPLNQLKRDITKPVAGSQFLGGHC